MPAAAPPRRESAARSSSTRIARARACRCGAGVAAAAGGARSVTNLDFSETALEIGRANADANGLLSPAFRTVRDDALPALRDLAGLPARADRRRRRGARPSRRRLPAQQFDVAVLDPPTWASSAHGAVDIVRDYQSIFKPTLLATRQGGTILATNHVSTVDLDEWLGALRRCADKAGRPLSCVDVLTPEGDFPSPDGRYPLKMALATVA